MSCAALSNSSARMAMQQLRNYPHFLARPIALCFVFEPADKQFFAASLLQLGFVLDTALSKTSEPLLAMIRLKWWIDALQHDLQETAPLVKDLCILCDNKQDMRDTLIALIGYWQDACQNEERNSQRGWQYLWQFLGETFSVDPCQAITVGLFAMSLNAETEHKFLDRSSLFALRRTEQGNYSQWLYLLACLGEYRRRGEQLHLHRKDMLMLGWHMLLWSLGRPPR